MHQLIKDSINEAILKHHQPWQCIDTGHHRVLRTIQASEHYPIHDMAPQGPPDHSSTEVMHH